MQKARIKPRFFILLPGKFTFQLSWFYQVALIIVMDGDCFFH
jgi:hypothetical protein